MRCLLAISFLTTLGLADVARAENAKATHEFVIEHAGAGGSAQDAAPYIEKFMRYLEKAAGWPAGSAAGEFAAEPQEALDYIKAHKPSFGLMDPDLWLALRKDHELVPIATVLGKRQSAGKMYILVKKDAPAKKLDDLKGKKLATNHFQSAKYVSKIVLDGKVADAAKFFEVVKTPSMIKALKSVENGTADAALIDQVDMDYLKDNKSPYLESQRVLFESGKVPPTPVVVFKKNGGEKDAETVKKALTTMCSDEKSGGKQVCTDLEIEKFAPADKAAFDEAVRRYEK
jgi:ABC-type phosphate/phosphonate transport system substrate-binding protein